MGWTPKRSALFAVDRSDNINAESLGLKLQGELGSDQVLTFLKRGIPMIQAILQLSLQVTGETVAKGGVDSLDVIAPLHRGSSVSDRAVELLIPAQGAE